MEWQAHLLLWSVEDLSTWVHLPPAASWIPSGWAVGLCCWLLSSWWDNEFPSAPPWWFLSFLTFFFTSIKRTVCPSLMFSPSSLLFSVDIPEGWLKRRPSQTPSLALWLISSTWSSHMTSIYRALSSPLLIAWRQHCPVSFEDSHRLCWGQCEAKKLY